MALATVVLASFHLSSPAQETSDSLTRRVLSEYGIRFSEGNSVKLLKSGQEKFDDMFEAIRQARHSVHLEYFNFRNDSIAWLLLNLLREKRSEGVEVRALFDGFGNDSNNQPLKKEHITSLRNDSVDIWEFDPIRFPWVNHIWPRDHRKIVVIDGHTAYTGGMNVADYYIKGTEQVGEWRDMHCRIVGPAVTELQHIFMRIWKRTTGEEVTGRQYFWPGVIAEDQTPGRNKTVGIVNREPGTKRLADGGLLGKHNAARRLYVTAIDNAQDSIRIINPYFMPVPSVMKALKRAIKRGVKVVIMVSAKSDIPLTPDAVFYNVHRLMKRGATVWVYQPGFHHSKIMMVDGRFCTVGSTNLDARSLRFDYEENALILNQETTRELDDMFNRDIEKSVLMTPETWNQMRTRWQKFRGWFGHLLGPWM
jgi:cardiolipin synthase